MASFVGSQIHVDRPLSNFATAYTNNQLIGLPLAPQIIVDHSSDKFFKRNKANVVRYQSPLLSGLQVPPEIEQGVTVDSFACLDYGYSAKIALRDQVNADVPLNLQQDATMDTMSQLTLAQESRIATLLTTSSLYDSNNVTTLSGSDRWDSASGGDPLGVIDDLRAKVWPGPNTKLKCFMGIEVWNKLKRHPAILDLVKGGATTGVPAVVLKARMAELLEVDEVLVGEAWQIATNPGQTDAATRVWGKYLGLVRVADMPTTRSLHFASSFTFGNVNVMTWIDQAPGLLGAWKMKSTHSTAEKVVASDAGALVVSPIS